MLRMILASLALLLTLSGCTINASMFGGAQQEFAEVTLEGKSSSKVAMISVEGTITGEDTRSLFGGSPNTVDRVRRQLDLAAADDNVKAVILRVNSPGGGATASDTILHEIKAFKEETNKPIVAFFQDMAASGGYYISMAADEIVAQPTGITGSIGVIAVFMDVEELLSDIGVRTYVIRSSPRKAAMNPLVPKTEEDMAHMQDIINRFYREFYNKVREGRPAIPEARLKEIADGRVFFADQAKELGLVDHLGYIDDAFERAKALAKIDQAKLITYTQRTGDKQQTVYTQASDGSPLKIALADRTGLLNEGPAFMYLWDR